MSRIRIDDSAEYWWSLPCSLLRDSRLSYEARGVACHLLSLGRNWQLRAVALPRVLHDQSRAKGHLGRDLCRRILRELEDAGYLARRKFQDEEGLWRWESVLTPVSQKVSQTSMAVLAGDGETVDGTSVAGEGGDICVGEYKEEVVVKNIKPLLQTGAVDNSPKTGEASAPLDLSHPSLLPYLRVISDVTRRFGPSLTAEQIQLAADELAGVLSAAGSGKHVGIRSVRSWLLAVMNSAVAGEFIPEFAPNIARWRKNRQEAMEAAQSRAPVQQSEAERQKTKAERIKAIADLKAMLDRAGSNDRRG